MPDNQDRLNKNLEDIKTAIYVLALEILIAALIKH